MTDIPFDQHTLTALQEARDRGWECCWWPHDTIGGEFVGLEVRNANGYLLQRHPGYVMDVNGKVIDGKEPDWNVEIILTLMWAEEAEKRREARRTKTRLRRAWEALQGEVHLDVTIDPKHEPRPPRSLLLERELRDEHGLGRREARKVARQRQARGTGPGENPSELSERTTKRTPQPESAPQPNRRPPCKPPTPTTASPSVEPPAASGCSPGASGSSSNSCGDTT